MHDPKQIAVIRKGASYNVPMYKITSDGLTDVHPQPIPFVKGSRDDESIYRQEGFVTESLIQLCKMHLEELNQGELASEETSSAIMFLGKALECIEARAAKRKQAGVQGTYKPTPEEPNALQEPRV